MQVTPPSVVACEKVPRCGLVERRDYQRGPPAGSCDLIFADTNAASLKIMNTQQGPNSCDSESSDKSCLK